MNIYKIVFLLVVLLFNSIYSQTIIEKELAQLYRNSQYDKMLSKSALILKSNPENSFVNLITGRALYDMRKQIDATPFLKKAIEFDAENSWITAWALHYLGKIEYFRDNPKLAKKYFSKSIKLNATKNVTNSSKRKLLLLGIDEFFNDWKIVETENFRFHFQPNSNIIDVDEFVNLRQMAYNQISKIFETQLSKKIDFISWNSIEDANKIGIKSLGFSKPEFCLIHSRTNQTIGHEITHILVGNLEGSIKKRNKFINEGIAVAFDLSSEDKIKTAKKLKLDSGFTNKISIWEAWEKGKKYPEWVYYQLAGEFIKRLQKIGGNQKIIELAKNQTIANAKILYKIDLEKIIAEIENEIN